MISVPIASSPTCQCDKKKCLMHLKAAVQMALNSPGHWSKVVHYYPIGPGLK